MTIRKLLGRVRRRLWPSPMDHHQYERMSVPDTFRRIYRHQVWGSNGEQFYSGPGSHGPASDLYCAAVAAYIRENEIRSVVDCGCGDFSVGRRIVDSTEAKYTGVDVVPELIQHHRRKFGGPRVSFVCANIITDELPAADLYLVRQVLQHLTNDEITTVLARFSRYPKVMITEDIPSEPTSFNHDMTHGPEVRSDFGSGVYVDRPPFSLSVKEIAQFALSETCTLRTVLVDNAGTAVTNRSK
jgi:SAM-dependent methyltransferase